MDLFNIIQLPEDDSYYNRVSSVQQMSNFMQNLMINPVSNMGFGPIGIMGINPQPIMAGAVAVHPLPAPIGTGRWMYPAGGNAVFPSMGLMGGGVHSFCSSTMMSMSTGPDGRPVVYQATSSTRSGPGGVCETKKAVCDNYSGTKKVQIGRHIGNRGHIIEREQNYISGEREEREDFINIDEDDAQNFKEEFEYRSQVTRPNSYGQMQQHNPANGSSTGALLALPSSSQTYAGVPTSANGSSTGALMALPSSSQTYTRGPTSASAWGDDNYANNYPSTSGADTSTSSEVEQKICYMEVGDQALEDNQKTYLNGYEHVN